MIPRLLEGERGTYFDLKISEDEVSWIASSCLVGAYLIVFVSNPLVSRIGKRKVMLMDSIVMILGTLVNVLSKNIILMCIGRLLMGILKTTQVVLFWTEVFKRGWAVAKRDSWIKSIQSDGELFSEWLLATFHNSFPCSEHLEATVLEYHNATDPL